MISELLIVNSNQLNPYVNLAAEKLLTDTVKPHQFILFLWQNERTVVIGKNQSCLSQCNTTLIQNDGGFIARRLSGGGAVYHDIGNLNFSFITSRENYNLSNQLGIVIQALKSLGINAEKSGRNDITVDGRKVSGNAFILSGASCCHHGTIMVNVDVSDLDKYLLVSKEKLNQNGVKSVRSRVANLTDFNEKATVPQLRQALIDSAQAVCRCECTYRDLPDLNADKLCKMQAFFADKGWIFNKNQKADFLISHRFRWGEFSANFDLSGDTITAVRVYTDCLNPDIFSEISDTIIGKKLSSNDLASTFENYNIQHQETFFDNFTASNSSIFSDIAEYIKSLQI